MTTNMDSIFMNREEQPCHCSAFFFFLRACHCSALSITWLTSMTSSRLEVSQWLDLQTYLLPEAFIFQHLMHLDTWCHSIGFYDRRGVRKHRWLQQYDWCLVDPVHSSDETTFFFLLCTRHLQCVVRGTHWTRWSRLGWNLKAVSQNGPRPLKWV